MKREDLTPEQLEELEKSQSAEEVVKMVKSWGYTLTDEEVDEIAGGGWSPKSVLPKCPACGSLEVSSFPVPSTGMTHCLCNKCGFQWNRSPLG